MASYKDRVEIIVEGAVIETARAELSTRPPTSVEITEWGGTLVPSGGRPIFDPAFLNLHSVFTVRLKNGREAQVVKKRTTRDSHHTVVEIAQASGGPVPF
jgi:hypothetical protein